MGELLVAMGGTLDLRHGSRSRSGSLLFFCMYVLAMVFQRKDVRVVVVVDIYFGIVFNSESFLSYMVPNRHCGAGPE